MSSSDDSDSDDRPQFTPPPSGGKMDPEMVKKLRNKKQDDQKLKDMIAELEEQEKAKKEGRPYFPKGTKLDPKSIMKNKKKNKDQAYADKMVEELEKEQAKKKRARERTALDPSYDSFDDWSDEETGGTTVQNIGGVKKSKKDDTKEEL